MASRVSKPSKGGFGILGKGGAKRHRKILRDNIQGITKPAILRLVYRAGGKRISKLIYEEIRGVIKVELENLQRDAVTIAEYARRKTIQSQDFFTALEITDRHSAIGLDSTGSHLGTTGETANIEKYSKVIEGSEAKKTKSKRSTKASVPRGVKRPHRFRPGTVAIRSIKRFQKSGNFLIRKAPFNRLLREITQDFKTDLRMTKTYFTLMQSYLEYRIVFMLRKALMCMIAAKRQTLQSRDIQTARSIMFNPYYY